MANIWGTIGKKSIKAIGGMTKAEIEAAKEAERAAAQASWDRVAGMEPAREKTGLRYSPAIGPELAGRQYAKDTAKFPGMAEYEPRISDTDWLKSWNKDEPLYHGMSAPMSGDFLYPTRHPSFPEPRGISLSPSRDTAAQYGDNIIETYGRGQYGEGQAFMARARELMASGKSSAEASAIAQKELQDQGFTGVRMSPREVSIFDPKDLRRTDAAFDPAKKDSKDLLAQAMLGAGIGAGGYALGAPQDADAMPDAYALKEALTLTLGAGVAGGVYANAPTRSDELNDLIGPAFDKLAGGDYLGAGFALGQGVPEYLKRRQGDPQAVAADAFELWDPTGLASIPLQWWDQNKYNEDVVRRPDFSSDGGGPEVARYKKRAIFAKGRK